MGGSRVPTLYVLESLAAAAVKTMRRRFPRGSQLFENATTFQVRSLFLAPTSAHHDSITPRTVTSSTAKDQRRPPSLPCAHPTAA